MFRKSKWCIFPALINTREVLQKMTSVYLSSCQMPTNDVSHSEKEAAFKTVKKAISINTMSHFIKVNRASNIGGELRRPSTATAKSIFHGKI